jgi:hypothetical protein
MTAAAGVDHLNEAARDAILRALALKHERHTFLDEEYTAEKQAEIVLRINQLLEDSNYRLSDSDHEEFLRQVTPNLPLDFEKHIKLSGKTLGIGGFGKVVEGRYKVPEDPDFPVRGYRVAVKLAPSSIALMRELAFLDRVKHTNIVAYFGYCHMPSSGLIGLVFERCDFSLDGVDPYAGVIMKGVNPFKIISEVAEALEYMHSYSCIHRGTVFYGDCFKSSTYLHS